MADAEEEAAPREEKQQEEKEKDEEEQSSRTGGPEAPEPDESRIEEAEQQVEEAREVKEDRAGGWQRGAVSVETTLEQFKRRKFFVLRPGTLNQAIKDVEALVNEEVDGGVCSVWLMAEVDHWNNEKERLVLITQHSLLVFKYDFIMFMCEQIQRIPLNYIDRISHGTFAFPKTSVLQREGEGLRVFWDRLREPTFTSRWNPFATDFPYITFTYHPVRDVSDPLAALCEIHNFRDQLKDAAQRGHALKPVPGKANGVLVLNQPIQIETYLGVMSFLGNQNKLGYSMARGSIGF